MNMTVHINLFVSGLHKIHIISQHSVSYNTARNLQGEGVDVAGVDCMYVKYDKIPVVIITFISYNFISAKEKTIEESC